MKCKRETKNHLVNVHRQLKTDARQGVVSGPGGVRFFLTMLIKLLQLPMLCFLSVQQNELSCSFFGAMTEGQKLQVPEVHRSTRSRY